jgi:hypothetical protein
MAMPNWALGSGASADINLVAGADFDTAHTLSTKQSKTTGDFTLGFAARKPTDEIAAVNILDMPVALVRTGTGQINVAAGRDVVLKLISMDQLVDANNTLLVFTSEKIPQNDKLSLSHKTLVVGASIYTSGDVITDDEGLLKSNIPMNVLNPHYMGNHEGGVVMTPAVFTKNGGALTVKASRDILGPVNRSGFYQNGDYSLTIEPEHDVFDPISYLVKSIADPDLATEKQIQKALGWLDHGHICKQ